VEREPIDETMYAKIEEEEEGGFISMCVCDLFEPS
jgi:hypothetical protein